MIHICKQQFRIVIERHSIKIFVKIQKAQSGMNDHMNNRASIQASAEVHSVFYKDHSTIAYIIITQEFDLHIWKIFYDDLFNNCEAILNKMHCKIVPLSHYVIVKLIVLSIFNSIGDGRSLDWLKDYSLCISHFLLLRIFFESVYCTKI